MFHLHVRLFVRPSRPNEKIARLFEAIGERRRDPLEQLVTQTRLRPHQLCHEFAREPQEAAISLAAHGDGLTIGRPEDGPTEKRPGSRTVPTRRSSTP